MVGPHALRNTHAGFLLIAAVCLLLSDLSLTTGDPWHELQRVGLGFLQPQLLDGPVLFAALANTLAFALLGLTGGALLGMALAHVFHWPGMAAFCALLRSVHEIFWALIFLQIFGLSTLTGLLAILVPYVGTFAKVYAEILDEQDPAPFRSLPSGSGWLSANLYTRLALAWPQLRSYTLYRLECALRASAILGFIGLPTLGFHLDTFFKQGDYSEAAGLLYVFFALIASLRYWARRQLLPLYWLAAFWWLPWDWVWNPDVAWRFLSEDLLPAPLRQQGFTSDSLLATLDWGWQLLSGPALVGTFNTLLLSMTALVGTGLTALLLYPLISPLFFGRLARGAGHLFLVVLRSLPELMLAYLVLLITGPSMLPAILALSWHNGAIIAHLLGRHTEHLTLRPDAPIGANRYLYETTPRLYRPFLAFLFYRWEVIMRESAILGILGIQTLGFFVDSAFEEIRFDQALFLILLTALLNILIDALSRRLRQRLKLTGY